MLIAEEAQRKRARRKHRPIHRSPARRTEDRVGPAERQQIPMQRVRGGVRLPFAKVQYAARKRRRIGGVGEILSVALAEIDDARELRQKLEPSLPDNVDEFWIQIREI